jgi:hypothetical protein
MAHIAGFFSKPRPHGMSTHSYTREELISIRYVAQRLAELWRHFAGLERLLPEKGTSILGSFLGGD